MSSPYYPPAYHAAVRWLVAFGAHGGTAKDRAGCRAALAVALRDARQRHGREAASHERRHLIFISGMFPVKG